MRHLFHPALASYLDRFGLEYLRTIKKLTPPIPYLLVMYPDIGNNGKQYISDKYDKTNFSLDVSDLRNRYLLLQQRFHPDRSASMLDTTKIPASSQNRLEDQISLEHLSHLIGEAYLNLRDPIKRAEHWLCMHQTHSTHMGCHSCNLSCDKMSPMLPEFLEELISLHEDIDKGNCSMHSEITLRKQNIIESLPALIKTCQWNQLSIALSKYRYLDALTNRI